MRAPSKGIVVFWWSIITSREERNKGKKYSKKYLLSMVPGTDIRVRCLDEKKFFLLTEISKPMFRTPQHPSISFLLSDTGLAPFMTDLWLSQYHPTPISVHEACICTYSVPGKGHFVYLPNSLQVFLTNTNTSSTSIRRHKIFSISLHQMTPMTIAFDNINSSY